MFFGFDFRLGDIGFGGRGGNWSGMKGWGMGVYNQGYSGGFMQEVLRRVGG